MTAADMPDNTGNKIQFFWTQPQKKPKNDAKLKRTPLFEPDLSYLLWDKCITTE